MAITSSVSYGHVTQIATVTDSTTYTSPVRSFYGLALFVETFNDDLTLSTAIDITDPNTATSWEVGISQSGSYTFTIIALPYEADMGTPTGVYVADDYAIDDDSIWKYDGSDFAIASDFEPYDYTSTLRGSTSSLITSHVQDEHLERYLVKASRGCKNKNITDCLKASRNAATFRYNDNDPKRADQILRNLTKKYIE